MGCSKRHVLAVDHTPVTFTLIASGSVKAIGITKKGDFPHLHRWFSYIDGLPSTVEALTNLAKARRYAVSVHAIALCTAVKQDIALGKSEHNWSRCFT